MGAKAGNMIHAFNSFGFLASGENEWGEGWGINKPLRGIKRGVIGGLYKGGEKNDRKFCLETFPFSELCCLGAPNNSVKPKKKTGEKNS